MQAIQGYKKLNTNNQVSKSVESLIEVAFIVSNLFHSLIVVGK